MNLTLYIILLLGGLYLLIRGSDIFVEGSVYIAKYFKLSELLIGMTLVCFGTSMPELFVSVNGSLKGTSDLVIGNMIGSCLFNLCIILGFVSIIHPVRLLKDTARKDIYMSLVTGTILLLLMLDTPGTMLRQNIISRTDGAILLVLFAVFIYYTLYHIVNIAASTRKRKIMRKTEKRTNEERQKAEHKQKIELVKNIIICILGGSLVYAGSECVLNGAVGLATLLGVSETFIAILIIAVGTSLPEVATSISAIKKRRINIAVGNLIGSNMYNLLFITGVAGIVNPLNVVTTALWVDVAVFILVIAILIIFTKIRFVNKGSYELSRLEGIILIVVYVTYAAYVIIRG